MDEQKKLTSPSVVKQLMKKNDLRFNKKFGQNFLVDEQTLQNIVDLIDLSENDFVLEIGPGIGTLTRELSKHAKQVMTVEIDKKLIPVLEDVLIDENGLFPNIEIVNADILKFDFDTINKKKHIKVVGNLPYYITSAILMRFLESQLQIKDMTFLMQKEVAERLVAKPSTKAYGVLSIITQHLADVEILREIPPTVFMPEPSVTSSLVKITPKSKKLPKEVNDTDYFKVVKAAFSNRRKKLINSLSTGLQMDKDTLRKILEEVEINPDLRAENLSPEDYIKLTKVLSYAR